MNLIYQLIVCLFVKNTVCQNFAKNVFSINLTEHVKVKYGDCLNIPYEYTFPLKNVTLPYTRVWFNGNKELREPGLRTFVGTKYLTLEQLPLGEHVFGLRLEWGHNETYTYPETVRVSVSASTKSPAVTIDKLIEGRPASMRCTAPTLCNHEEPKIKWGGANVTLVQESPHRMRFSPPTSEARITPKADHHNTNITCQLHYRYITLTKTVTLKVQHSPKILSSSKCVRNEIEIVCNCVSYGNPLPTVHFIPSGLRTKYTSNDNYSVEEIVYFPWSYSLNSTITCVSRNYLGRDTKNFSAQNLMDSNALTVPWTITGVSLCLSLVMLIIAIFQYKQAHKKRCNEEVNMYASLRGLSVDQEYSVISPRHNNQC